MHARFCYGPDGKLVGVMDRSWVGGDKYRLRWSRIEYDADGFFHEVSPTDEPLMSLDAVDPRAVEIGKLLLRRAGCNGSLGACRRRR